MGITMKLCYCYCVVKQLEAETFGKILPCHLWEVLLNCCCLPKKSTQALSKHHGKDAYLVLKGLQSASVDVNISQKHLNASMKQFKLDKK